ncbi:retrovirus-related pol polyprotein from transposon TNT 1-94 [Tanacetum coccineum]
MGKSYTPIHQREEHGRMMLDSIDNGPPVYPTVEEDGQTRPKKYSKLTEAQQLQDNCDVQATNIILHGTELSYQERECKLYNLFDKFTSIEGESLYEYYWRFSQLINDMHTIRMTMQQVQVNTKFLNALPLEWSKFVTDQGEVSIDCINKAMAFISVVESRQTQSFADTRNKGIATTSRGNFAASQPRVVKCYNCQGEGHMMRECTQPKRPRSAAWFKEKLMLAEAQEAGQILDEEVPYSESYPNDMINQDVQEMTYSKQTHIDDYPNNEINSDSNIIPYSQYLQESQDAGIQDTNSSTSDDLLVLSLVEQMTDHLNKIKEDIGKRFVTKKELHVEQALWLKHSNYNPDTSIMSHTPVRIEAPSELPKCSVDKIIFEIQIKQLCIDNDQLLKQITSKEIVHIAVNSVYILNVNKSCVDECNKYLELETELLIKKDLIEKDVYDKLLKTHSQEKDTVIRKLKDRIKSLSGKDSVENVKKDNDEIETINIELEHNQFDSIRKTRVQSNEHCASLIAKMNEKSVANSDLNAQLQEMVFAIATLKNKLRKLKGKNFVDTAVSKPSATIAPGMFKLDIEPISHRHKNNRDAYEVYLEKTIENTNTLRGLVECSRKQNPSEPLLKYACTFTKHVQELFVYVSKTCPSLTKPTEKLVVVTPVNKDKKFRFAEPVTSSSNIPKKTDSLKTNDSNKPLLTSTGVNTTTSASGSKPSGNTKKNRISRPLSSNQKNKVVQIVLWYLDSGCSKHMTGDLSQLINFVGKFLGTVKFWSDHIAKIMGYGDYQMGNVTISRVYYVEGLVSKRRAFWNLNEDILKITILKTNTPYPLGRYGVSVPALTKDYSGIKINTPYLEDSIRRIQDMESI